MICYKYKNVNASGRAVAEAVWEAADGKPDRSSARAATAARRPRQRGLWAFSARVAFLDDGMHGRRMSSASCTDYIRLCGGIPLGVSGLRRQRAARRLAGNGWPRRATACRRWCTPGPMSAPRRMSVAGRCGAGAGRCGQRALSCEPGAIVNMGAPSRTTTACVGVVRPSGARGRGQGRQHRCPRRSKMESGTVLERGAAFLPLGGPACLNC